ncbi:MAG: DegT/DnrJ/EryC1/StrS family aminotransferase [Bacillota bacterium]
MASQLALHGGTPVRTRPFPAWPVFDTAEEESLLKALRSGKWGSLEGEMVRTFEREFAQLHGARYGVTVVNGTMALAVALRALGVGPGDEVLVPPYTFIATASAAFMVGAIPVFVDVDPETLLLDPAKIEAAVTPRTKAIIPVHYGGCPADMDRIMAAAKKHGLKVIEDAAQAHGASWRGQMAGSIGDVGTFSFQSSKAMSAGEGGIMLTQDPAVEELLWSLQNVGRRRGGEWYEHVRIGWNLRLTEFQAAILLAQLKRLPAQLEARSRAAAYLTEQLSQIPGLHVPPVPEGVTAHGWHLFYCMWRGAAESGISKEHLVRALNAEGIPVFGGYVPLNRNQAIIDEIARTGGTPPADCPVAERAVADEILVFRMQMLHGTQDDLNDIVEALAKVTGVGA